jgi:hypothetical protein
MSNAPPEDVVAAWTAGRCQNHNAPICSVATDQNAALLNGRSRFTRAVAATGATAFIKTMCTTM